MRFGPDGNLYVDNGSTILRFSGTTGAPMGVFTPSGSGGLVAIDDFLFASTGKLLVSGINGGTNDTVYQFDGATGSYLGIFASGNGMNVPEGLAEGTDGNLYVASFFSQEIKRFDLLSGTFVDNFVTNTQGRFPSYIEFTPFPVPEPTSLGLVLIPFLLVARRAFSRSASDLQN
jgi:streptogramin lyase